LGFIALSQLTGNDSGSRWLVPQTLYTPILQDAVLLKKGASNEAATAFMTFLKGPEARAIIVLHHYLDLPMPEVAIALGIPLGTAKSRLHRSLGSMRAALDADDRPRSEFRQGLA